MVKGNIKGMLLASFVGMMCAIWVPALLWFCWVYMNGTLIFWPNIPSIQMTPAMNARVNYWMVYEFPTIPLFVLIMLATWLIIFIICYIISD